MAKHRQKALEVQNMAESEIKAPMNRRKCLQGYPPMQVLEREGEKYIYKNLNILYILRKWSQG